MSELKTRLLGQTMNEYGCDTKIYLKSEADKVIAELKEKLKEQTSIAEEGWKDFRTYHTSYAEAVEELYEKNNELRHQKYKRCLAMAKWCYSMDCKMLDEAADNGTYFKESWCWKRALWYGKWKRKWLELAEKFKEAK